jgi:hypothetical protein
MGHCISVYLIHKSEFRNEKINSIIEGKDSDIGNVMSSKIKSKDLIWTELKEGILATEYIPNIKEWGKGKTIARISTDYFGGAGHQTAKVFIDNKKVYDKSSEFDWKENPINDALKMLGVEHKPGADEFDTIGLGRYRSNADFNHEV